MLAAKILAKEGIDVEVIDVRTISPLDENDHWRIRMQDRASGAGSRSLPRLWSSKRMGMVAIEKAFDYLQAPPSARWLVVIYPFPLPIASKKASGQKPRTFLKLFVG